MEITKNSTESEFSSKPNQRKFELKSFDDTMAGVKGLVDEKITEIPKIFIHERDLFNEIPQKSKPQFEFPIIDLYNNRKEIVESIHSASENWGFFQVVNHGVEISVMEEMLDGVRRFFEQESEEKKKLYTRDSKKTVVYNSNFDLYYSPAANWRDTLFCNIFPDLPNLEDLPPVCSEIMIEYTNRITKLGNYLLELLSEALGLEKSRLKEIGCADGMAMLMHYYPKCPQPELTLGTSKHADGDFFTILLQDNIGGLQILHQNRHWVDVPPLPSAFVVNIGDLLQLISNDKFKSVEHRVVAQEIGPRVSVACFFRTDFLPSEYHVEPISELVSEDNPAKYKKISVKEYVSYNNAKGLDGNSALLHFRIQNS
jgi:isopenicillin N synthase-like dioxygenase